MRLRIVSLALLALLGAGLLAGCRSSAPATQPPPKGTGISTPIYPPTNGPPASPYPPPSEIPPDLTPSSPPVTGLDTPLEGNILLPLLTAGGGAPPVERVLLISVDGLRPDAIVSLATGEIHAPFLYSLSQEGAVSWDAQTVTPSTTIPGHASMLTGLDVNGHGVDIMETKEIFARNPYIPVPTVFELARNYGLRTVMIAGKKKMRYFLRPDSLDEVILLDDSNPDTKLDRRVSLQARKSMKKGFNLMFLHFPDVDGSGHEFGWLSEKYLGTVRRADKAIRDVYKKLEDLGLAESTLVLVTADHGGDDWGHSASGPEDRTIPWIIAGPGVQPGTDLTGHRIRIMDSTATILWTLGIPAPAGLDGRPIVEAFSGALTPEP